MARGLAAHPPRFLFTPPPNFLGGVMLWRAGYGGDAIVGGKGGVFSALKPLIWVAAP